MSFEELLFKILSAVFSIGAILLVLYYINKQALKKAERMNEELKKMEEKQSNVNDSKNNKYKKK